jgi:hypothetical protein
MRKSRGTRLALALAPLAIFASPSARANDPLVWMENCPFDPLHPRQMRCLSSALVPRSYADARRRARLARPLTAPPDAGEGVDASADVFPCDGRIAGGGGSTQTGWAPSDYVTAYNIPTSPTGAGEIVAIVDACSEHTIVADLAAYRAAYGLGDLPGCGADGGAEGAVPTPGGARCFGVVSQRGGSDLPPPDSQWAGEIALDVEMVSLACPACSILLVEADTPNSWDLGPAVNEAVALGASAVSNSYGAPEDPNDPFGPLYSDGAYAADYEHPGVLIAVASGDGNYDNEDTQGATTLVPSFPSTVPSVLSVGGTSLASGGASSARGGYSETVWSNFSFGTTSGCSSEFARPAFQDAIDTGSCNARADVDVAASAELVSTYMGGGWLEENGTSCASPFVAALFTRLGLASQANAYFYARSSQFYDVSDGSKNDPKGKCTDAVMCTALAGWDGPTGWGTPNGGALAGEDAGPSGGDDAAAPTDAGAATDAANETDAATGTDGGTDAGHGTDGGDGGGIRDGGVGRDATVDGGGGPDDAGLVAAGGDATVGDEEAGDGASGASSGCGCTDVGSSPLPRAPAGVAFLAFAWLASARRRRRR